MSALLVGGRARALLEDLHVRALVGRSPENVLHATGLDDPLASAIRAPLATIVAPGDPVRVALVAPAASAARIATLEHVPSIVSFYGDEPQVPGPAAGALEERVSALLHDRALRSRSPSDAIEAACAALGVAAHELVEDSAEFGQRAWRGLRRIKTPDEIERLRAALAVVEHVEHEIVADSRPGASSRRVLEVEARARSRGAQEIASMSGAGRESSLFVGLEDWPLGEGEIVRLDICCRYRSYWGDSGRTAVVGAPSAELERRYSALRAGIEAALATAKPGVRLSDLYEAAVGTVRASGIASYARAHCGHSIGLSLYDGDLVAPGSDVVLEPNMVLNVEVPYYEIGWGGLQVEETVSITDDGHELLNCLPRDLLAAGQ